MIRLLAVAIIVVLALIGAYVSRPAPDTSAGAQLCVPASGTVGWLYGNKPASEGSPPFHNGVDIWGTAGVSPIYAAADGKAYIISTAWGGTYVKIHHSKLGNLWTFYDHMGSGNIVVSNGQNVKKGEKIGYIGTDRADGVPHVHFAVNVTATGNETNINVDPSSYLGLDVSYPRPPSWLASISSNCPNPQTPTPTPKKCVGKDVRLDFSCDGVADLAAMYDYGGGLTKAWFFYNNGPGTLTPHVAWASNSGSWTWANTKLVAGDFSGDGVDELAAMYDYGGGLTKAWFFYNNGPGTLTPHLAWASSPGSWTWANTKLVAGDFSGDGTDELAAMYDYGGGLTKIWFFYNNGPGTLTPHLAWSSDPGGWTWANTKLVAGDFNGDGTDDLAAMYDYGGGLTKIWFFYTNKASGTVTTHMAWSSHPGGWTWANTKLVAGDFSGDGTDDLAAMYDYGGGLTKIWFFYNNGPGTLTTHRAWSSHLGGWTWANTKLVAGDFSGDGTDDLAAMYDYGSSNMKIWFFYNNGPGTLTAHKAYTSCSGCWSWANTKLAGEATDDEAPPPPETPTATPTDGALPTPGPITPTPTVTPTGQTPTPTGTVLGETGTPDGSPTETPTATPTPSPVHTAAPVTVHGDADCDGGVTTVDALTILATLGQIPPVLPAGCASLIDLNCDGGLDGRDALLILLYLAAKPVTVANCWSIGTELT